MGDLRQDVARRLWNANSKTWDDLLDDAEAVAHIDEVARWLAESIPATVTVVDLGCGTGNYSIRLAERGHRVLGVDYAEGMLERARSKTAAAGLDNLVLVRASVQKGLPLRTGAAGAVLCIYVIQLFDPDDLLAAVRGVLQPGGHLLIEMPRPGTSLSRHLPGEPWSHRAFRQFKRRAARIGSKVGAMRYHTRDELCAALDRQGFEVIAERDAPRSFLLLCRASAIPAISTG